MDTCDHATPSSGKGRLLKPRGAALRENAADRTATITDQWSRPVMIPSPEAVVMSRTATLFDECADDIRDRMRQVALS